MSKALQHATAKYLLQRVEVKSFTVPTGNRSITKQNLFLGQLPTQLVVGVVDNEAYNGVITKSPFYFKHNNINFMTIYQDAVQIPSKPLQPDFTNDRFIRSYLRLFTQTGQYYCNTGNAISREQYKTVVPCSLLISRLRWIRASRFRIDKARQHTNRNLFCYWYYTHSYCDCVCRKRQPTGNRSRQKRCF